MRQQSAVSAGLGGFGVRVQGHTHLEGGATTTKGGREGSVLLTQTFSHADVLDRDVVQGRSIVVDLALARNAMSDGTGSASAAPGPLAGSSVGHAHIYTGARGHALAGLNAPVQLTLPALNAERTAAVRAAQRAPHEQRRQQVLNELAWLYANEPPQCPSCQIANRDPSAPSLSENTQASATGAVPPAATVDAPAAETSSSSTAWLAWLQRVQQLQAEHAALDARIAAKRFGDVSTIFDPARAPSLMHQPLLPSFDASKATQQLRDGVAVTAAFGKAAYRTAGDIADQKRRDALSACGPAVTSCPEAKLWGEGGAYRVALHMAVGAIGGGLPGASAAGLMNLMNNATPQVLAALGIDGAAKDALQTLIGTAAAAGAFGTTGAVAAFNLDANNRQLHPDEIAYARSKIRRWAERSGLTDAEAERQLIRGALYDNDLKYSDAVRDFLPHQIVAYKAAADFLREEARIDGFMLRWSDGTSQAAFTSTPEQRANAMLLAREVWQDDRARDAYWRQANIRIGELSIAGLGRLTAKGGVGLGHGVAAGVDSRLAALIGVFDPATYSQLVQGVKATLSDPKAAIERILATASQGAQDAALSAWLGWLRADSQALGASAGRVLGEALVDGVVLATGLAAVQRSVEGLERVTDSVQSLRRAASAENSRINGNAGVLGAGAPRVLNGVEISPNLQVEPAAGWHYSPSVVPRANSENLAWSHWVAHQTEVRLASQLADQGLIVVRWGDKIGTHGADVIAVNPANGTVMLFDAKYRSADQGIGGSKTFDATKSTWIESQLPALKEQAIRAISSAEMSPGIRDVAIQNVRDGNFIANTAGFGAARNSVAQRFCSGQPC